MAGYIGPIPVPQATQTRETFTATASQTTFNTAGYQPGYLDVFMNGVKLIDGSDYTATNGSDVVLSSGAAVNDLIEVVAYTAFEVLNQNFTGTTTVADLTVTGDLTVDGTTTTINSTTLNVDDINITVASGAADAAAANGAGLTVDGANATFNYASSGDKWTMNKDLDITGDLFVPSGNFLVGKQSNGLANDGLELSSTGYIGASISNDVAAYFNRRGNAGDVVSIMDDQVQVGALSTGSGGYMAIRGGNNTFGSGLLFGNVSIKPTSASGVVSDGAVDLGDTGARFKDLHLSGTANVNTVALGVNPTVTFQSNYLRFQTATASVPVMELLASASGNYSPRFDIFNGQGQLYSRIDAGGGTVFNDQGEDLDFRVESASNANALLVDAGNNSVAINRSYGIAPLHVSGSANNTVAPENSYAKITDQGLDGLAIGSIASSPFSAWIQSGYTSNTYSPDWNNGYPLALNPVNANVVIGGTNVTDSTDGLAIQSSSRDNISIQYLGTAGGHESKIRFFDFRGQENARISNNLQDDGVGTASAHLDFDTAVGSTLSQRLRIGGKNQTEAVFNDPGYDYNFRVESDSNAHMFMIDAGMNKAAFGTSPQTALGGLLHTGSLSVGAANHIGYSVYSNHEGNIPSNTTVSVMDFEGPAYARYMKVTVSGYLCRKEVYFAGYQSWDNQSGSTVGSTTVGTQIFANGSNASAVTIYLEVLSTSGTSGNPKYRLKISTGGLSGQLYDTTSVVEFFNPPYYVTYQ